jgi:hypothetical protein
VKDRVPVFFESWLRKRGSGIVSLPPASFVDG